MALSDRVAVLQAGRIEQCGEPLELYREPANLFVAGFVGSPPINVLDATLFPDLRLPCGARATDVLVGLRPAEVVVSREPAPHALAGEVLLCEPTGEGFWVVGSVQGRRVTGRAARAEPLPPGTAVHFGYASARRYFFERATGRRLR